MTSPLFTAIGELDIPSVRCEGYPGAPAPMFTEIVETDILAFRAGLRFPVSLEELAAAGLCPDCLVAPVPVSGAL